MSLPALRLTGATVLRDGALQQRSVAFEAGRLTHGPLPEIDLSGFLILPGLVDLRAAGVNRLDPASADGASVLAGMDRVASAHGLTTCRWPLTIGWERPEKGLDLGRRLAASLVRNRQHLMTNLRLQIQCEINQTAVADQILDLVRSEVADLVVFSDLASELDDLSRDDPLAFEHWCRTTGQRPNDVGQALAAFLTCQADMPRHLCRLAEAFDARAVLYGSYRDRQAESREHFSMIGARLCFDPQTTKVAVAARAVGDPVLVSASDLFESSNTGAAVHAIDLVAAGHCDALVSDRHPAALAQAPFRLAELGVMSFATAWDLVSKRPAELLRLPDRGVIEPGRRADLVVVNTATQQIEATVSGGRLAYLAGKALERFLHPPIEQVIAAE